MYLLSCSACRSGSTPILAYLCSFRSSLPIAKASRTKSYTVIYMEMHLLDQQMLRKVELGEKLTQTFYSKTRPNVYYLQLQNVNNISTSIGIHQRFICFRWHGLKIKATNINIAHTLCMQLNTHIPALSVSHDNLIKSESHHGSSTNKQCHTRRSSFWDISSELYGRITTFWWHFLLHRLFHQGGRHFAFSRRFWFPVFCNIGLQSVHSADTLT